MTSFESPHRGAEPDGDAPLLSLEENGSEVEAPSERRSLQIVSAATGRRVPFDRRRLEKSVERARAASGSGLEHEHLDQEVCDIVAFTLKSRAATNGPATTDEVGALVERVLMELGAMATAREYIVVRDRKGRALAFDRGEDTSGGAGLPQVLGAAGAEPFRVQRIASALIEEAGLSREPAEDVAERVAETLRSSSLRTVSTGLVRELVSNELLALGLAHALRRHEAVGLPRHDLQRLFDSSRASDLGTLELTDLEERAASAPRFEDEVSSEILRRWSIEDLLSPASAEAHAVGDIHVTGLGAPHRSMTRSIAISLLRPSTAETQWTKATALATVERAARSARDTVRGTILEELDPFLSPFENDEDMLHLLLSLGASATAGERRIDLARTDAGVASVRGGGLTARLMRSTRRGLAIGATMPRIYIGPAELLAGLESAESAEAAETLLASGHLVPVWAEPGARWAGHACTRLPDERGALGLSSAVAINLPRAARRAGPWREDVFLESIHHMLGVAAAAASERAAVVERARRTQGEFASERRTLALIPVGLIEALRILSDGPARADLGARILGFIHDAARRIGQGMDVDVRITTAFGETAAARFAASDAQLRGQARQPRLFRDLPRPEEDATNSYRAKLNPPWEGWNPNQPTAPAASNARGPSAAGSDDAGTGGLRHLMGRAEALGVLLQTSPTGALLAGLGAGPGDTAPRSEALSAALLSKTWESLDLPECAWERPRLAAWSRFSRIRSAASGQSPSEPLRTLF